VHNDSHHKAANEGHPTQAHALGVCILTLQVPDANLVTGGKRCLRNVEQHRVKDQNVTVTFTAKLAAGLLLTKLPSMSMLHASTVVLPTGSCSRLKQCTPL